MVKQSCSSKLHKSCENIIIQGVTSAVFPGKGGADVSTVCYDINLDKGDPLAQSDARLLNITWAQYSSEWNSTMHAHRHAEMFFIMSGSGTFQLQRHSFPVSGRSLVIINPGVMHCEQSNQGSPMEYIVLGVAGRGKPGDGCQRAGLCPHDLPPGLGRDFGLPAPYAAGGALRAGRILPGVPADAGDNTAAHPAPQRPVPGQRGGGDG